MNVFISRSAVSAFCLCVFSLSVRASDESAFSQLEEWADQQTVAPSPRIGTPKPVDNGKFVLAYGSASKAENKKIEQTLKELKLFEQNVALLNDEFLLPYDITVELSECGQDNAFYKSEDRKITVCYELIAHTAKLLRPVTKPREAAEVLALHDAIHTFYHELGHALIDIYRLPAVGREEDAADQFATLVLLASDEAGEEAAQIADLRFLLGAKERKGKFIFWRKKDKLVFWDEHSLDQQRFYDNLCLIYGKNPEKYKSFVEEGVLPQERAEGCPLEYSRLDAAWDELLAPHVKTGNGKTPLAQTPPK